MRIGPLGRLLLTLGIAGAVTALSGCGAEDGATGPGAPESLGIATTSTAPPPDDGGTATHGGTGPDGPPRHADNRGWRQRAELSSADRARAEDATERILDVLAPLRQEGAFAPDAVASAIESAGFPGDAITTAPVRRARGTSFGVHVGDAGCVVGTVRPDRLSAEPKGAAAEFGCLEPFSH
ncbi:hypothetical protein [Saccharomonospora saliphila]|uniref:hypothetical protein n=1 Tax=Saccharomonospora saliphila TaxID=369829 RepID=UPI00036AA0D0|nr:hypothetical protein [Saccharomonospora saliphila]